MATRLVVLLTVVVVAVCSTTALAASAAEPPNPTDPTDRRAAARRRRSIGRGHGGAGEDPLLSIRGEADVLLPDERLARGQRPRRRAIRDDPHRRQADRHGAATVPRDPAGDRRKAHELTVTYGSHGLPTQISIDPSAERRRRGAVLLRASLRPPLTGLPCQGTWPGTSSSPAADSAASTPRARSRASCRRTALRCASSPRTTSCSTRRCCRARPPARSSRAMSSSRCARSSTARSTCAWGRSPARRPSATSSTYARWTAARRSCATTS